MNEWGIFFWIVALRAAWKMVWSRCVASRVILGDRANAKRRMGQFHVADASANLHTLHKRSQALRSYQFSHVNFRAGRCHLQLYIQHDDPRARNAMLANLHPIQHLPRRHPHSPHLIIPQSQSNKHIVFYKPMRRSVRTFPLLARSCGAVRCGWHRVEDEGHGVDDFCVGCVVCGLMRISGES